MKNYLRTLGLLFTALLPNLLKRPIYRICFGYTIGRNVRIGVAFLDCAKFSIDDDARIAHGVAFLRCGDVRIGKHAVIGLLNLFRGGERIELGDYSLVIRQNIINAIPDNDCTNNPAPSFYLGYGSVVTAEHRIDFTDRVTIGRCSIFGGRNSTIWTHNRRTGKPVEIGNYCYVGSEIRMAPGAKIPDCCIVGLGSVVTGAHEESYCLIAGVPAKKRRKLTADDYELIFGKTRSDLPDQVYPKLEEASAALSQQSEVDK
jgi:acetyltransferase-like isoleucine patch superfamily enzyme